MKPRPANPTRTLRLWLSIVANGAVAVTAIGKLAFMLKAVRAQQSISEFDWIATFAAVLASTLVIGVSSRWIFAQQYKRDNESMSEEQCWRIEGGAIATTLFVGLLLMGIYVANLSFAMADSFLWPISLIVGGITAIALGILLILAGRAIYSALDRSFSLEPIFTKPVNTDFVDPVGRAKAYLRKYEIIDELHHQILEARESLEREWNPYGAQRCESLEKKLAIWCRCAELIKATGVQDLMPFIGRPDLPCVDITDGAAGDQGGGSDDAE